MASFKAITVIYYYLLTTTYFIPLPSTNAFIDRRPYCALTSVVHRPNEFQQNIRQTASFKPLKQSNHNHRLKSGDEKSTTMFAHKERDTFETQTLLVESTPLPSSPSTTTAALPSTSFKESFFSRKPNKEEVLSVFTVSKLLSSNFFFVSAILGLIAKKNPKFEQARDVSKLFIWPMILLRSALLQVMELAKVDEIASQQSKILNLGIVAAGFHVMFGNKMFNLLSLLPRHSRLFTILSSLLGRMQSFVDATIHGGGGGLPIPTALGDVESIGVSSNNVKIPNVLTHLFFAPSLQMLFYFGLPSITAIKSIFRDSKLKPISGRKKAMALAHAALCMEALFNTASAGSFSFPLLKASILMVLYNNLLEDNAHQKMSMKGASSLITSLAYTYGRSLMSFKSKPLLYTWFNGFGLLVCLLGMLPATANYFM